MPVSSSEQGSQGEEVAPSIFHGGVRLRHVLLFFFNVRLPDEAPALRPLTEGPEGKAKRKPPFICDVCNRSFARKTARTSHLRIHARGGYECTDCGRRFSNSSHLSRHRRCHLDDSEWFVCPECWAGFARKDVMQRHMLSHTGERPYTCRVCGDVFTQRASARRHEKSSHGVE
ncbi:hypothetical protein MTO96_051743 [Rhipicephalus appendiculatus]